MFKQRLRGKLIVITYLFILVLVIMHFDFLMSIIRGLILTMTPFIYGLAMAYIINWIYVFVYKRVTTKSSELRKVFSITISYVFVLCIIAFLIVFIFPQVVSSITNIIEMCVNYLPDWKKKAENLFQGTSLEPYVMKSIEKFNSYLTTLAEPVLIFTKNLTRGIYNWVIGLIISVYLIAGKETLILQTKRALGIILSKRINREIMEICALFHNVFGKFIKGKILDSIIIGVLCFIGMTVLGIPFAVLISVVVAFTNIIPFFGPFIGAIPSIMIVFVVDPIKAVWFMIFIFILQQLDGNVIGPKIVGNSVGLSGISIIFSVLLGGAVGGFAGMLLGVPVFAVIYSIVGRIVKRQEKKLNKAAAKEEG